MQKNWPHDKASTAFCPTGRRSSPRFRRPTQRHGKNAARLLGALGQPQDAAALASALSAETTLFVVPSILLALGSVGGSAAEKALGAYIAPEAKEESEVKHAREIQAALAKARSALAREVPLPVRTGLAYKRDVLLVSPAGFGGILQKEVSDLGFRATVQKNGVLVHTDDLKRLFAARCAMEVLIPVAEALPIEPDQIARAADGPLTRPYRIELRGFPGDRAGLIRAVAAALGGGDDPSRYADELRIVCRGTVCDVSVRPCDVPDTRFDYRKCAIAASIHPAMAACLARYALSFADAGHPRVLDPFCGSGTLVFELERAAPTAALLGVDISEQALQAARTNALAAKSKARFLRKDILKFSPREPFDLILSNLPFGNRVGTHATNEPLYRGFVKLLPEFLPPGGVAVLYTMEHKLLTACIKREPALNVVAEARTEAGGLNPRVTVVKRK